LLLRGTTGSRLEKERNYYLIAARQGRTIIAITSQWMCRNPAPFSTGKQTVGFGDSPCAKMAMVPAVGGSGGLA